MAPRGQTSPQAEALSEGQPGETLHGLLAARATDDPDQPAILSPGAEGLSVGDLVGRMDRIRHDLNAHGFGRGDRVAVLAWMGPEAAVAVLGVASAGICIPISPLAMAELEAALSQTGSRALVAPAGADAAVREVSARLGLALLEGRRAGGLALTDGPVRPAASTGPAEADDVALVLRTSGTALTPKRVPSTHAQLLARARKACRLLEVGAGDRSLCLMPLCYAHGLYTGLVTSLAAGGSVILPPRFDEEIFVECLVDLSPTWGSAGATHHTAILGWLEQRGARGPRHRLRFLRSGAAALPRATREGLEALLGVPVVEAYSSSETGIISANAPNGRRRAGSVGAVAREEVVVVDEGGTPVPPGTPGEVLVRGPGVFSGYEGDAELNDRAFRDGWFRTRDRGVLDADGYLTLAGRVDDVINRGGEKVSPAEVEAALEDHPDVAEAIVVGVPHPTLVTDVSAAVRMKPRRAACGPELRAFLEERLAPFKVPRRIVAVPEIPRGPTGKPRRRDLAAQLADTPAAKGETSEPDTAGPLEGILASFWAQVLGVEEVGPDADFFDLGGDSLSGVELLTAIEEELNVGLGLEDVLRAPTPRRLARALARGSYLDAHRPDSGRDAVGVNTAGTRPPIFTVGGRPGYALRALLVGRAVDPDQPVYGLQPPGMDWVGRGISTIPEMAAHYLELVRAVQPSGPYRLLGASFGGLIVYAMALQLEGDGDEVEFLGLVDTKPARCAWDAWGNAAPAPPPDDEGERPGRGGSGAIVAAGTRVAATHSRARSAYLMQERVRADMTYFSCAGEGVAAGGDPRRVWVNATAGRFRLLVLPGLHARFDREPQFSALRDALRACLSETPPPGLDPVDVFDRTYSLEQRPGGETIRDGAGASFRVEKGAMRGRVGSVRAARNSLLVRGWASHADRRRAGDTVIAFVDGRYAGYSTCGFPTERLERRHSAPGLRYAGFRFRLPLPAAGREPEVRVYALGEDGRASELSR